MGHLLTVLDENFMHDIQSKYKHMSACIVLTFVHIDLFICFLYTDKLTYIQILLSMVSNSNFKYQRILE